jgi:hypothetical protein
LEMGMNAVPRGQRRRFAAPDRPLGVVFAVYFALLLAFGGACLAQWVAWHGASALVSDGVATTWAHQGMAINADGPAERHDVLFGHRLGADWSTRLLGGDDYEPGYVRLSFTLSPGSGNRVIAEAQFRLRAAGWRTVAAGNRFNLFVAQRGDQFVAQRDDQRIEAHWSGSPDQLFLDFTRVAPAGSAAAEVVGTLVGAVAGWLLVGWALRRACRGRRGRGAMAMAAVGAGLLAPGLLLTLVLLGRAALEPGAQLAPLWGPFMFVGIHFLGLLGALALLVCLGLLLTRRQTPPSEPSPLNHHW